MIVIEGADSGPWIDVSVPVHPGLPVWPGDPSVEVERISSVTAGDPATVSRLSMSSHTGTHMDAPAHFLAEGETMDALAPDTVVGRTRIIDLPDLPEGSVVGEADLRPHAPEKGERILLKTRNSRHAWLDAPFRDDFVALDQSAARYLAERGIGLVGVDYLSVSSFHADPAPVHRALLSAGIWIVEGLDLSKVEAGPFDLICLPLRIAGADGAPARAFLRRIEESPTTR